MWGVYFPHFVQSAWYRVSRVGHNQFVTRICPRQAWLTKQIPRQWNDKVNLIPDLLYACVVHFVSPNGENALDTVHFEPEDIAMLNEIDVWARIGRKAACQEVMDAHPKLPEDIVEWLNRESTDEKRACYAEVTRLEGIIEERDDKYLQWIVANHRKLWT